jgi:hypothetical protein
MRVSSGLGLGGKEIWCNPSRYYLRKYIENIGSSKPLTLYESHWQGQNFSCCDPPQFLISFKHHTDQKNTSQKFLRHLLPSHHTLFLLLRLHPLSFSPKLTPPLVLGLGKYAGIFLFKGLILKNLDDVEVGTFFF